MRRLALALALLVPAVARAAGPAQTSWPQFRGGWQHASTAAATAALHPKILWSLPLNTSSDYGGGLWSWQKATKNGPTIGPDGTIYVSAYSQLTAVNPNGTIKWQTPEYSWPLSQPAVSDDGKVFVSSIGSVVALSTDTGAVLWQVNPAMGGGDPYGGGAITIGPDGTLFTADSGDGGIALIPAGPASIYAISPSTGGVLWRSQPTSGMTSIGSPALSPNGTTVYAVVRQGANAAFVALSSSTGGVTRSQAISGGWTGGALAVDGDGSLYAYKNVAADDRRLMRLDLLSGTTVWTSARVQTANNDLPYGPVIGPAHVYGYDDTLGLVAYDKATGNIAWSRYQYPAAPPVLVGGTTLYYISPSAGWASLHAVHAVTGASLWVASYDNTMSFREGADNAVAVSSAGTVYVLHAGVVNERRLYAFSDTRVADISVSTSGPTYQVTASTIQVSSITVRLRDGLGNPIDGAILRARVDELNQNTTLMLSTGSRPISGTEPWQLATTTSGIVTLLHTLDIGALPHSVWETYSSSVPLELLGSGTYFPLIQETRASTFTLSLSTPSIEWDSASMIVRVTTITVTVTSSTGSRVAAHAVAVDAIDHNTFLGAPCGTPATVSPGFALTNSTGQATFVHRMVVTADQLVCGGMTLDNWQARVRGFALGLPPVTVDTKDTRISTFTVSFSTGRIQPDIQGTTMTVTAYDIFGATVPNAIVALDNLPSTPKMATFGYGFRGYEPSNSVCTGVSSLFGFTDALGQARFHVFLRAGCDGDSDYDDFDDTLSTFPVAAMNIASVQPKIMLESNMLASFSVEAATEASVGVSFASTVTARNKYNRMIARFKTNGITLTPLISGTSVQGLGVFGTGSIDFTAATPGRLSLTNQTYNKIESIQMKASRASDGKEGFSDTINVLGPARFQIDVPTGAVAGQQFISTITALDKNGVKVVGYSGTLSLTALQAGNTTQAATGSLGVSNINLPSTGRVTFTNQTYSKGEGIRVRAYDSALGVEGVSSSMTITEPTLTISHYRVSVPTQVTVGVPFRAQFVALDASSNPVTYALSRSLNIQALLSLSPEIAGTGALGTSASSLVSGTTNTLITNQTYNKIQTVYIKVSDEDGRVGISTHAVVFSGPTQFDVTIATYAQAGVPFQMIVTARDGGGQQVLGYDGTVSVAAVQSGNTSLSGAGILGVTSLNIASGLGVSAFQTYTKAEGIRLRINDTAIGVTSYSSSMTVRAGPAASMSVGANPQSTVASVPSVLTATVLDQYSNPVQGSTVTYSVLAGSGVLSLSLSGGSVVSAVTTTNSVTDASGQAGAFFGSTNTLSSQANLLRVTLGALTADTTIYNAVLITPAGGAIVNLADPRIRVDCPANAWSFNIRMSAQSKNELSAADLALTTAAFAAQADVFVSTIAAKLTAVRDSNPNQSAGTSPTKVSLSLPVEIDASSQVAVGAYRGQSMLVPLSVLRIFKLNSATSLFEMVLDGTNLANLSSRTVTAELSDPNGIYAIGAPPFTALASGSSGTVTAVLAAGATATVEVPFGAFSAATNLQVGVPSAASVPALPANRNMTGTGLTISIQTTNGLQPVRPVAVTIGYRAQDVLGLNPDHLRIARYDDSTGWVVLDSAVDTLTRKVTGNTDHFSLFQVVAVRPQGDLSAGIVFPNPFRPNAGHTMLKFGQLPATAKIRIFTVSGRMVKQLETDATGQVLGWDAKDKDGHPLPSGVYLALVESGRDKKTLKFAIQR